MITQNNQEDYWVHCPKCGSCGSYGCCSYGCEFCGYGQYHVVTSLEDLLEIDRTYLPENKYLKGHT